MEVVLRNAGAVEIAHGHCVLGLGVAEIGGLVEPSHRLAIILWNSTAHMIATGHFILSVTIPLLGGQLIPAGSLVGVAAIIVAAKEELRVGITGDGPLLDVLDAIATPVHGTDLTTSQTGHGEDNGQHASLHRNAP